MVSATPSPQQPDTYALIRASGKHKVDIRIGKQDALLVPGQTEIKVTAEPGVFNVTRLSVPLSSGEVVYGQGFISDTTTLSHGTRLTYCCMAGELGNGRNDGLGTLFIQSLDLLADHLIFSVAEGNPARESLVVLDAQKLGSLAFEVVPYFGDSAALDVASGI